MTTMTGRRLRGQRLLGGDAHQRLAADLGQQLVRPAHAGRAPGGEDDRGDIALPCSGAGSARGCGRVTISISSPPTPMPVMSSRVTGRPASSRISTQSKPFSFGERAQPGAPSTGTPPALPISSRLPGSTGMPKCSIAPPIASIAAGMTSRRSAMADAPNTMTSSAPCLEHLLDRRRQRGLRHAARGARRRSSRRRARAAPR